MRTTCPHKMHSSMLFVADDLAHGHMTPRSASREVGAVAVGETACSGARGGRQGTVCDFAVFGPVPRPGFRSVYAYGMCPPTFYM